MTTIVAPAGFGKSTALAQAMRANLVRPRGIDVWIACEEGDTRPGAVLGAVARALGLVAGSDVDAVLDAIASQSPSQVAVILDDLQFLGQDGAAIEGLASLIRRLPANGHLVLASRAEIPLPLARLRAAGDLVEIDAAELAFTGPEAEAFGSATAGVGGWPALVRLGVDDATARHVNDFVWEEVMPDFEPAALDALLVVVIAGGADEALVHAVLGDIGPLDAALQGIPLISWHGHDARAHDLWESVLGRELAGDRARELRVLIVAVALERRRWRLAFDLGVRLGDHGVIAQAIRAAVRARPAVRFGSVAIRLHAELDPVMQDTIEGRLLDGIARCRLNATDAVGLAAIDEALELVRAEEDLETEAALASIRLEVSFMGRDMVTLADLVERAHVLDAAGAISDHGYRVYEVMMLDLAGRLDEAAALLDDFDVTAMAFGARTGIERMRSNIYILVGRATDAAAAGRRLVELTGGGFVVNMAHSAEWFAGHPRSILGPVEGRPAPEVQVDVTTSRIYFNIFAAHGDTEVERLPEPPFDSRDSTLVALANAGTAIDDGDEEQARRDVGELLDRMPLGSDGRSLGEFVRLLPRGYLLDARARDFFDAADLTPELEVQRLVCRQFLDLRAGRRLEPGTLVDSERVFTVLPASWQVEYACRLVATGTPGGEAAALALLLFAQDVAGIDVRRRLNRVDDRDPALAGAAKRLRAVVPVPPREAVTLKVFDDLRLVRGGVEVTDNDWRSLRVRELVAMLALDGPLTRDRIMDRMWPDMDPTRATNNFRVTLSKARRVLEPERDRDAPPYALRQVDDRFELAAPPSVRVDVVRFDELVARARECDERGQASAAGEHYREALALVETSGPFLADFGEWGDAHRRRLETDVASVSVRCGELMLAAGESEEAESLAASALAVDPHRESAHRVIAAARHASGDRLGALAALKDARAMLDDLGVPESPETTMLDRLVRGSA